MIDSEIVVGTGLRITVSRDELAAKLAIVARAVSTRTAVLVLGGIQLRAEDGRLHLAATDMELSLRASLDAQVADEGIGRRPGPAAARHRTLAARRATSSIEHRPDEAIVVVTSGPADLPAPHVLAPRTSRGCPTSRPRRCTRSTATRWSRPSARVGRSASRDESRPVLTGILVRFEPGKIVMAATDSYRLAVKETPVAGPLPELEAIIPARALQELARIAAGADEVQLGRATKTTSSSAPTARG